MHGILTLKRNRKCNGYLVSVTRYKESALRRRGGHQFWYRFTVEGYHNGIEWEPYTSLQNYPTQPDCWIAGLAHAAGLKRSVSPGKT